MSDQDAWYYSHDGQDRVGPMPWKQIQEYMKGGVLTPETLLWSPNLSEWTPAGRLVHVRRGMGTALKAVLISVSVLISLGVLGGIVGSIKESQREEQVRAIQAKEAQEHAYFARGLQLINRSHMNTMVRAYGGPFGKPFASACRAKDFPDLVLVTVAWPGNRLIQSMVDPNNPPQFIIPKEIPGGRVDPSLTNWNCTIDDQGNILLKGFERQCIPQ